MAKTTNKTDYELVQDELTKIGAILADMQMGGLEAEVAVTGINFYLMDDRRYMWRIYTDWEATAEQPMLRYGSVPSHGHFQASSSDYTYYLSIGMILFQVDKLAEIEECYRTINDII